MLSGSEFSNGHSSASLSESLLSNPFLRSTGDGSHQSTYSKKKRTLNEYVEEPYLPYEAKSTLLKTYGASCSSSSHSSEKYEGKYPVNLSNLEKETAKRCAESLLREMFGLELPRPPKSSHGKQGLSRLWQKLRSSQDEKIKSLGHLIRPKIGTKKPGVFGISLSTLSANDVVEDRMGPVPRIVMECLETMRTKGLNTTGIFRVSGSAKRIKEIKDLYMSGEPIDWSNYTIHDVAGVLKAYLRELPDELIPSHLSTMIAEHVLPIHSTTHRADQDMTRCLLGLQCLVLLLPARHASLLFTLFQFFEELSRWSKSESSHSLGTEEGNGMNAENIAIIMAPNFFHHSQVITGQDQSTSVDTTSEVDQFMQSLRMPHGSCAQLVKLLETFILYHPHLWTISRTLAERMAHEFQKKFLENLISTQSNDKKSRTISRRKLIKKKLSTHDPRHENPIQASDSILWSPNRTTGAQLDDNPIYKEPEDVPKRPPTPRPEDSNMLFDFDMRTLEPAFKKVRIHELFVK